MSEQTNISFEAALMIALRADAQKELDTLPTPEQLEELYPDTSQWDERMAVALRRKKTPSDVETGVGCSLDAGGADPWRTCGQRILPQGSLHDDSKVSAH